MNGDTSINKEWSQVLYVNFSERKNALIQINTLDFGFKSTA